jgi:tetratricopeptide (TPR) repeat protein
MERLREGERYPRFVSSRARLRAIVAAAAVAAAAVAVTVAWVGRGDEGEAAAVETGPRAGAPPLALDVLTGDAGEAVALESATRLYEEGERAAARDAFAAVLAANPESLWAQVGEAMARWPNGTIPALRELEREHGRSGLVRLHLGLALYWLRQDVAAEAQWRAAEDADPDSYAAIRAETLLHPEMPQGRPFFVPSVAVAASIAELTPLEQLDALERAARDDDDARAWIQYGVALQRLGRPISAAEAFDHAAELAPHDAEALAAAAVGRFDKDDPSQAFSRLGPLTQRYPEAGVVRFHLGLMLLWLSQVDEAREQLRAAIDAEPDTIYGREAALLLDRLQEAGAATTG